jgi:hypothetical protein
MRYFFENINNIAKQTLDKLTKRKREKTQINNIGDEKMDITTNTHEIQRIIRA